MATMLAKTSVAGASVAQLKTSSISGQQLRGAFAPARPTPVRR